MYKHYNEGFIEVICGPMFASKTETLISRIVSLQYAKKKIKIFKPVYDNRYSDDFIVSHAGSRIEAIPVRDSREIEKILFANMEELPDVVVVDEVQFFDLGVVETINNLANLGVRVIAAGLDQDFTGQPFDIVASLMARAEHVIKLTAVCTVCGNAATMSQRLRDGQPVTTDDGILQLGAEESYEARCRAHHDVKEVDVDE